MPFSSPPNIPRGAGFPTFEPTTGGAAEPGAKSSGGAFDVLDDHALARVLDFAGPRATIDLGLASQALAERTMRLRPASAGEILALRITAAAAPRVGSLLGSSWCRAALAYQHEVVLAHKGLRVSHAEAAFAALAAGGSIKSLRLVSCHFQSDKAMTALQRSALPLRLEALEMRDCRLDAAALDGVLNASPWPRLRHLNLSDNDFGASGLAAVCRASHLRGLTFLSLANNSFGRRGLNPLVRATHLESLEDLDLAGHDLSAKDLRMFAHISWWSSLTRLCLRVDDDIAEDFVSSAWAAHLPSLDALRVLTLGWRHQDVQSRLVQALSDGPHLTQLKILDLDNEFVWGRNLLSSAAVVALSKSSALGCLRSINLHAAVMDAAACEAFLAANFLDSLTELSVVWSPLGADATARLLQNRRLSGLRSLSLCVADNMPHLALQTAPFLCGLTHLTLCCGHHFYADIGRVIAGLDDLCGLEELCLGDGEGGDALAGALKDAAPLRGLTRLTLHRLEMTGVGLGSVAASPHLTALRHLDLSDNFLSDSDIESFAATRLFARLHVLFLGCDNVNEEMWPQARWIGDHAARAMASCRQTLRLRRLVFFASRVSDDGFAALAASEALTGLTRLEVDRSLVTQRSLLTLATATGLTRLEVLSLESNDFGADRSQRAGHCFDSVPVDVELSALAGGGKCLRLRELSLPSVQIGEDAARSLLASTSLGALRRLRVDTTLADSETQRRFHARFWG